MKAEEWLKNRTFHHSLFWDLRKLVEEKQKQNLKISLCLPTLNEENTIGKEIVIFKSELFDRYPLLDEIVVMDSNSKDKTREIAEKFGATVYQATEVLPETGCFFGKGENLWKDLYVLKGDIVVYIDADIKNIHPRFVTGLIGPLILNPEIKYVKAFYDRPLTFSDVMRPSGGGRVTEILVRPLFSLFYPELTAVMQPLSGEYAGRRDVFERIPFPVGYGVETSMLIDILHRWGMDAIAQTDLDRRIHRNQETVALGRMAFGILQAFFSRLKAEEIITISKALPTLMRQVKSENNEYSFNDYTIEEIERQPIIEIPAYKEKYGIQ